MLQNLLKQRAPSFFSFPPTTFRCVNEKKKGNCLKFRYFIILQSVLPLKYGVAEYAYKQLIAKEVFISFGEDSSRYERAFEMLYFGNLPLFKKLLRFSTGGFDVGKAYGNGAHLTQQATFNSNRLTRVTSSDPEIALNITGSKNKRHLNL